MPKNLTGSAGTFPTQTSPVAGEPRTAGSVEMPFQNAADRTQFLYDRLTFIDPTREGVRRVRRAVGLDALKALTDDALVDGTICSVDRIGVFQYDAAATDTETPPVIVTPTSVGVGAGRWIAIALGLASLDVANGVPQLDSSGLIPTARLAAAAAGPKILAPNVANGLVAQSFVSTDPSFIIVPDTTVRDVPSSDILVSSVLAGDRLDILYQADIGLTAGDHVEVNVRIVNPDATTIDRRTIIAERLASAEAVVQASVLHVQAVAQMDGAFTIRLRAVGNAANTGTDSVGQIDGRVHVYRA